MKKHVQSSRARAEAGRHVALALGALLLCASGTAARAQGITTPLHLGTLAPTVDEFGFVLQGNASMNPASRDLVHILWAEDSVIYPPALDGTPDPGNPPVEGASASIGALTSPIFVEPGIFGAAIAKPRPPNGSKLFVRVFNAPTLEDASFYGDSQILTVDGNKVLIAEITAADIPLDSRDTDGDGLNNSWEKSMGSDANRWDTDGDGVSDGDEFRSGTGLLDPNSVFIVAQITPYGEKGLKIEWDSVPGKSYVVQYSTNNFPDSESYVDYDGVITADSSITKKIVPNGRALERVHVRIKLVEP